MDVYSGKRAKNGLVAPRRGLRDTADSRDEDVQLRSRLECSGRLNHLKSSCVGAKEKSRSFKPTFNASNGKDVVGSSSRTSSVLSVRNAREESHIKSFSQVGNDQSEISSLNGVPEVTEQIQSLPEYQLNISSAARDTRSSKARSTEAGHSSGTSSCKPRKIVCHKSGSYNQHTPMHASVSSQSKAIDSEKRPCSSGAGYGLRNLKCKSISDVLPNNCSTSESRFSRRDMVKRRNSDGESTSSSKGKKVSGALPKGGDVIRPTRGISISDSRSGKNFDIREDSRAVSVRTRRSMNVPRLRDSVRDSSSGFFQNSPQPESPNFSLQSSSQFFSDASSSDSSAFSFPGNDVEDLPAGVSGTSAQLGINQLMNRDALQRYNMDGVAQVLLALERIEQDEELSYERLLALESNLFLSGLNFYDQHRDMRLDIDDMSYEELLALEERIGSVSTALPEEELSKCLRRNIYQGRASETETLEADEDGDDIKCSICQEEYVIGDEIGNLGCEHGYHMECIKQWFKLKNWCPICKAAVESSKTTS
uniref:RING-type E3 ubiquitin transferase n=1 Tax=Solanum chacoense TaxID=4108 RepID=A0A0V0IG89_SOLCH